MGTFEKNTSLVAQWSRLHQPVQKLQEKVQSLGQEDSLGEGNGNPLYFCLSHGQGSLTGYSLWGWKELDTT